MSFLEKMIAQLIERSLGHYVTTIIGVLVILSATLGGAAGAIAGNLTLYGFPVHSSLVTLAAVVLGIACVLAKDSGQTIPAQVESMPQGKAGLALLIALGVACAAPLHAQATGANPPAQASAQGIQNLYAAGASYSVGATPAIAGTALYAHQVIAPTDSYAGSTYAFSVADATPNTLKPFTVNTNIGVGLAQNIATIGKIPIFMPTSAGVSWNGTNTGFQWSAGVFAPIRLEGQYYLVPSVRFLKSSVSGGTGYQPIVGLLFGWGQ